ncbi:hypothetical protein BGZ82_011590 [Podila clonocystis]|nr:hypothetical protein BGZ82_011590 [Podila clonocystis]
MPFETPVMTNSHWSPVALACASIPFSDSGPSSDLKDSSTKFEYMEFPGWTDQESIKAYVSRVWKCLLDDKSKLTWGDHLPQEAIVAMERIVERNDLGGWKAATEDTEDRVSKGNLCKKLDRLHNKHNK